MKQLLIYEQPVALNRHQHRQLRLKAELGGFGFASHLNSVPLTTVEFAQAARDFPIVFAGSGAQAGMPAALLGLDQDDNLFVDAQGQWAADTYVPAFLRRYPFVVASKDEAPDDFTVCVEHAFVTDDESGLRLFEENGEDAPALQRAVGFLTDYQNEVRRTEAMMQQLHEHKLLIERTLKVDRPGKDMQTLSGFSVADEARLQKLGGKALEKLSRSGALGLLYVHLMSLSNVQRLSARWDARAARPLN